MKYIIVKGYICEMPFLFPRLVDHDDFYEMIKSEGPVVSAGFVNEEGYAHGKSTSLKIGSRPQDTEIIDRFMAE